MTTKDSPSNPNIDKKNEPKTEARGAQKHEKHRKHGYRGYPNKPGVGGDIHVGTGFAGVGPVGSVSSSGGIVTDKTRDSVEEREEEKKRK